MKIHVLVLKLYVYWEIITEYRNLNNKNRIKGQFSNVHTKPHLYTKRNLRIFRIWLETIKCIDEIIIVSIRKIHLVFLFVFYNLCQYVPDRYKAIRMFISTHSERGTRVHQPNCFMRIYLCMFLACKQTDWLLQLYSRACTRYRFRDTDSIIVFRNSSFNASHIALMTNILCAKNATYLKNLKSLPFKINILFVQVI